MKKNAVLDAVEKYIKSVKPIPPKKMPRPPFMHGYILGDTSKISYSAQVKLQDILSINHEIMDIEMKMHMDMDMDKMKHTLKNSP